MGSLLDMTNPATKKTAAKPAAKTATKTTKTTSKPAPVKSAKSTTKTTKPAAVKPTSEVTKTTKLDDSDSAALVAAFDKMNAARESFDDLVEHYLRNGVSPSHVGKPIGLGNSSIRRIAFRRNVEGIK